MTILPLILFVLIQQSPVVHVESIERGSTSWGTGTCVASTDESLVLTAWHIVKNGYEFKINGQSAKLIGTDKTWDLAALVIADKMPTVSIGVERPKVGDVLTICGYGSGDYKEVTGSVIHYGRPNSSEPSDILGVEAKTRNGDSGAPIFDSHGMLVAVLFGSDNIGAYGSCCTRIRLFIEGLKINPLLKQQALRRPYVIYAPHERK